VNVVYKEHWAFKKPDEENVKVWRYMDFTKFVSLLEKKSLFFSNPTMHGDKFEGSITEADFQQNVSLRGIVEKFFSRDAAEKNEKASAESRKRLKSLVCVNCWHINEFESAAMWKLYLKSNEGIAIQSTFKRLTESFNEYRDNYVYIGMIKYIDYTRESIPKNHFINPLMHKRISFEHERELRALISRFPMGFSKEPPRLNLSPFTDGLYVPIKLDTLIEKVHVAPSSETWFYELVKSVTKKYLDSDFSEKVKMSPLNSPPLF
jgi:hypothetical protein